MQQVPGKSGAISAKGKPMLVKGTDAFGLQLQWEDVILEHALTVCDRKIGPYPCCSVVEGDCMELMKALPDGCVDAVITDPNFGIGFAAQPTKWQRRSGAVPLTWDDCAADVAPLLRLAPIQAIWGGNYFPLPLSRGWLCWYKPDSPPSMGDFELAWTNLDRNTAHITYSISATNGERIGHPTQKPLAVMLWTIRQVGNPQSVLDPFCGSGTTLVAAKKLGRHFLGFEISPEYCAIARKRLAEIDAQPSLFEPKPEQMTL